MKRPATKNGGKNLVLSTLKPKDDIIHLNMNPNAFFFFEFPSSISIVYVLSFASMHSVQRLEGFR